MHHSKEDPLRDLEAGTQHNDPRLVHALDSDRPCPSPHYRHAPVWLLLVLGFAALASGIALRHGMLIAGGLMLAAAGSCLLNTHGDQDRRSGHPHQW